jgi:geranylgeranyl pyrophosphate synthase
MSLLSYRGRSQTNLHPLLEEVVRRLYISSSYPCASTDLFFAQLVLGWADLDGARIEKTLDLAASVEFIYFASCLHTQRIQIHNSTENQTVNQFQQDILVGDLALCKGLSLITSYGTTFTESLLMGFQSLINGDYSEFGLERHFSLPENIYLEHLFNKIAFFTTTCSRLSASCHDSRMIHMEALTNFSFSIGMAYQIKLDLLAQLNNNYQDGIETISNKAFAKKLLAFQPIHYGWRTFHSYLNRAEKSISSIPIVNTELPLLHLIQKLRRSPYDRGSEHHALG